MPAALSSRVGTASYGEMTVRRLRKSLFNTADQLRSSIACAGFVSCIRLLDGTSCTMVHPASRLHRSSNASSNFRRHLGLK